MLRTISSFAKYAKLLTAAPTYNTLTLASNIRFATVVNPPNVPKEKLHFKTETKKLLDIVAKSIYTEKEVFLRELLSNCADALEKQKFKELTNKAKMIDEPLHICLSTNEKNKSLIIFDTGVGMTKQEIIDNLGTIARSGTQEFIKNVKESDKSKVGTMIGQFGVGFYSTFIVAETVEVISKTDDSNVAYKWISDGNGEFEVTEVADPGFKRGTKIILYLKAECKRFSLEKEIDSIVKKYSLFISYPIKLNNDMLSGIQAIWYRNRNEISEDEYKRFYQYVTSTDKSYAFKLHYSADVPFTIKSVLYIPEKSDKQMGVMQEQCQLSLYSRKVLIKNNCTELLPRYLQFVKGVVDCEDIPLNISREGYQDSALIAKIREMLTKRIIKLLEEAMRETPEKYESWFNEYGIYLKEGLISDQDNMKSAINIIRYASSINDKTISLEEYSKAMKPEQKKIYFLNCPDRKSAEKSPYFEQFVGSEVPVILTNHPVDEIFFKQLDKFKEYSFVNIETDFSDIEQNLFKAKSKATVSIPSNEVNPFCMWIKSLCPYEIKNVKVSDRISHYPAIITSKISSSMRSILSIMSPAQLDSAEVTLEINPHHAINTNLNILKKTDMKSAKDLANVLLDLAIAQSGLPIKNRDMQKRIIDLLDEALALKISNSTLKIEGKTPPKQKLTPPKEAKKAESGKTSINDAKSKATKNYSVNEKGEIVI